VNCRNVKIDLFIDFLLENFDHAACYVASQGHKMCSKISNQSVCGEKV